MSALWECYQLCRRPNTAVDAGASYVHPACGEGSLIVDSRGDFFATQNFSVAAVETILFQGRNLFFFYFPLVSVEGDIWISHVAFC